MYIATQEVQLNDKTYKAGDEVPGATQRMIDTGVVKRASKSKAAPKKKKEEKVEKVELTEEILTEDSAEVTVTSED